MPRVKGNCPGAPTSADGLLPIRSAGERKERGSGATSRRSYAETWRFLDTSEGCLYNAQQLSTVKLTPLQMNTFGARSLRDLPGQVRFGSGAPRIPARWRMRRSV